jgi:hypothetical protein
MAVVIKDELAIELNDELVILTRAVPCGNCCK